MPRQVSSKDRRQTSNMNPLYVRREAARSAANAIVKKYRDLPTDTQRSIINDVDRFVQLAFLNPSLLVAALVMYSRGIRTVDVINNPSIIESYLDRIEVKTANREKINMNNIRNNLLRYIIKVEQHYHSDTGAMEELIAEQMEQARAEAEEIEIDEDLVTDFYED